MLGRTIKKYSCGYLYGQPYINLNSKVPLKQYVFFAVKTAGKATALSPFFLTSIKPHLIFFLILNRSSSHLQFCQSILLIICSSNRL